MLRMLLIKGAVSVALLHYSPRPTYKEGGLAYEAHYTVVGHHGPDPAGGKRAGTGSGGRLRHRG